MTQQSLGFSSIASAPIFVVSAPNLQITGPGFPPKLSIRSLAFQELSSINSEINIEQYIAVDSNGVVNHTKQFGVTKPPSVQLKRGLDSNLSLWYWHQMALLGLPKSRSDVTLEMFGGGLPSIARATPMTTMTLQNAWCAKINIASAKAGEGVVTEDVVIACDAIVLGDG